MSPQQEVFTHCLVLAKGLGAAYDYIPDDGSAFPFFYIGEQFSLDQANKTAVFGQVNQTIHLFHNDRRRRGDLSKLMEDFIQSLRKDKETRSYYIHILQVNQQVIYEKVGKESMLHGIIEVRIHFQYKGGRNNVRSNERD